MRKRYLLASAAVAALASSGQADAGDFYVSVLGGANWFADQSVLITESTDVNFDYEGDTGFIVGGAIGVHLDKWAHGLRAELEATYRRNDLNGHWISSGNDTGAIEGNVSTFALMVNVWYDIDIGQKFVPYVGGGAGWARHHAEIALLDSGGTLRSNGTTQLENSGFNWHIGVGFNYPVSPGVNVGVGYRYGSDPNLTGFKEGGEFGGEGFGGEGNYSVDNENHSVAINLTVDID
jgi:opacity protein-like surface antigen